MVQRLYVQDERNPDDVELILVLNPEEPKGEMGGHSPKVVKELAVECVSTSNTPVGILHFLVRHHKFVGKAAFIRIGPFVEEGPAQIVKVVLSTISAKPSVLVSLLLELSLRTNILSDGLLAVSVRIIVLRHLVSPFGFSEDDLRLAYLANRLKAIMFLYFLCHKEEV